jgi:hypothetical protein
MIHRLVRCLFLVALCAPPVLADAATYYLSPSGSDRARGTTEAAPWKTFETAFERMRAGDELVLLDGVYSEAGGTGYISYLGERSGQIPSGLDAARPTWVHAKHPGAVKIYGQLFIGRSTRKDSYIRIQGITFYGGGALYNTSYVTIQQSGFYSIGESGGMVFGIGTNDHSQGNSNNLIEDVWIWGRERGVAINYRGDRNIWRRVVIRGDGCRSRACAGGGNPNIGISVYESTNTSLQNVIVLDRVLDGGAPYADFAVAQHTPRMPHGNNEWLGTISLRAPDAGYYFEPDEASLSPAATIRNCVAWDSAGGGINMARTGITDIRNCTVKTLADDAVRVAPEMFGGVLENLLVIGKGRFGVNSAYKPSYVNVFGTWSEDAFNQTTCGRGCLAIDPFADGSLKYIVRIEDGSPLKGTAAAGADYGANVERRYGLDGSHYGEPGYNTLMSTPLWPWPNEARIRQEMCMEVGVTRGFCSAPSLTTYIWTYLGSPMVLPATPVHDPDLTEDGSKAPRTALPR